MAPVCFVIRGRCQEMQDVGEGGTRVEGGVGRGQEMGREKRGQISGDGDRGRRRRRRRRKDKIREQLRARAEEGGL